MADGYNMTDENIAKLEELLAAMKEGRPFTIEVDGERVAVPGHAEIDIEYDNDDGEHELDIQIYWEADEIEDEDEEEEEEGDEEV